jgi:hypothetical protein
MLYNVYSWDTIVKLSKEQRNKEQTFQTHAQAGQTFTWQYTCHFLSERKQNWCCFTSQLCNWNGLQIIVKTWDVELVGWLRLVRNSVAASLRICRIPSRNRVATTSATTTVTAWRSCVSFWRMRAGRCVQWSQTSQFCSYRSGHCTVNIICINVSLSLSENMSDSEDVEWKVM